MKRWTVRSAGTTGMQQMSYRFKTGQLTRLYGNSKHCKALPTWQGNEGPMRHTSAAASLDSTPRTTQPRGRDLKSELMVLMEAIAAGHALRVLECLLCLVVASK